MSSRQLGQSKVHRVIEDYDLEGMGETLETYWLREQDRYSLRELAAYFNKRVLHSAMSDVGIHSLEGEVENTYRLLTASDVSRGARRQAKRSLEHEGLDVDGIKQDFVSHQAIHTYLRDHRDAQLDEQSIPQEQSEKAKDTVEQLRNRTVAVTEDTVQRLANAGLVEQKAYDVVVDIRVVDPETGESVGIEEFLGDETPAEAQ